MPPAGNCAARHMCTSQAAAHKAPAARFRGCSRWVPGAGQREQDRCLGRLPPVPALTRHQCMGVACARLQRAAPQPRVGQRRTQRHARRTALAWRSCSSRSWSRTSSSLRAASSWSTRDTSREEGRDRGRPLCASWVSIAALLACGYAPSLLMVLGTPRAWWSCCSVGSLSRELRSALRVIIRYACQSTSFEREQTTTCFSLVQLLGTCTTAQRTHARQHTPPEAPRTHSATLRPGEPLELN